MSQFEDLMYCIHGLPHTAQVVTHRPLLSVFEPQTELAQLIILNSKSNTPHPTPKTQHYKKRICLTEKYIMAKFVQIDTSKNSVLVITFSAQEPTGAEFEEYLREMKALYKAHKDFVLVFDGSKAKYLSGKLRLRQAAWIRNNTRMIKENCVGMVYILPNVMIELIFKCIIAFNPLPVKNTTVRSLADAYTEAEKMLKVAV